ncbi:MAG: sorbosone dehydrogenase family protein [Gammaproteobacteria bacterium]
MMRAKTCSPSRLLVNGLLLGALAACDAPHADVTRLRVPEGFAIHVYAEGVENARQLAVGPEGLVFVGSRSAGNVYALVDADGDHRAEEVIVVARDLEMPSGVAYRDGALYVAALDRVLRFPDIAARYRQQPTPEVVYDRLPDDTHHGWKYLAFAPDGSLFVPVGAPCNICLEPAPYASILRFPPGGGEPGVFASGVRNSVGLAFHPDTGDLWFTDNGRDWLGDDLPSCELNRAPAPGLHFGFPFRHGRAVPDPDYGGQVPAGQAFTPPALELGAHVAPVGLLFHRHAAWPEPYRRNLFIAEHGSWNRSRKSGYRVVRVVLDESGSEVVAHEPFLTGWLEGETAWGRPADLAELPDGSVLIADDGADRVYRLYHRAE